jgi:hypothetical protein
MRVASAGPLLSTFQRLGKLRALMLDVSAVLGTSVIDMWCMGIRQTVVLMSCSNTCTNSKRVTRRQRSSRVWRSFRDVV